MRNTADLTRARLLESIELRRILVNSTIPDLLRRVIDVVVDCLRADGSVFFFGNGGSSADAGHLAAELLGHYRIERAPLRSVALADNTAAMTAIANDYGYEDAFARQLAGLGRPGDVAIGLSTSGRSANVVRAFEVARLAGITTVAFTGAGGGLLAGVADHLIAIPSIDTARIQECHVLLGHTVCEAVEAALFRPPTAIDVRTKTERERDALLDLLP
jgi:D-sedoheptulose 7-phosphate isomerase